MMKGSVASFPSSSSYATAPDFTTPPKTSDFTEYSTHLNTRQPLSSSSNTSYSAFTIFHYLPIELRRAIWAASIRGIGPRIIPIEPDDEFEEGDRESRCLARVPTPSILHVCSESRDEALRIYTLKFQAQLRHPIYFDKTRDTLFMSRTRSMYSFLQSTLEREKIAYEEFERDEVCSLALLVNDRGCSTIWTDDPVREHPEWRQVSIAARTFGNLKELKLIYRSTPGYDANLGAWNIASLNADWYRHWNASQGQRMKVLGNGDSYRFDHANYNPPNIMYRSREELETDIPAISRDTTRVNYVSANRTVYEPTFGRLWPFFYKEM